MAPPDIQEAIGENNDEMEKVKYPQKILNECQNIVYLASNEHNTPKYIDAGL